MRYHFLKSVILAIMPSAFAVCSISAKRQFFFNGIDCSFLHFATLLDFLSIRMNSILSSLCHTLQQLQAICSNQMLLFLFSHAETLCSFFKRKR